MEPVILITDGSKAAVSAERLALDIAKLYQTALKAVYILSTDWENLLGDEWINPAKNRLHFFRWLTDDLNKRADEVLEALSRRAEADGVIVEKEVITGHVDQVIVKLSQNCRVLVLPHIKGTFPSAEGGIKYSPNIVKKINCPLIIGGK